MFPAHPGPVLPPTGNFCRYTKCRLRSCELSNI